MPAERLARLRSLRALVHAFYGVLHPLNKALFLAESLEPEDLDWARLELDRVPARDRRKILATYAALVSFKVPREAKETEGGV